jgi:nucleoside-diphosphate-sugar epimerase
VTGGAGFIGSHLTKELSKAGHLVHSVDALIDTTYSADIKKKRWSQMHGLPGVTLSHLDLSKIETHDLLRDIDVVVNLAAMPGLQKSWEEFPKYLSSNVQLTQNILEGISKRPNIKLIQISTSSVYGLYAKCDENGDIKPISPYGVTKFAAEELVRAYAANYDLDYCILRYFSVYGPGQRPDMAYAKFIQSISAGTPIDVYGNGQQIRTNTFITDCISGTMNAISSFENGNVYNISGNFSISLLEAISIIEEQLGKRAQINFLARALGDQQETLGDHKKATSAFKYNPSIEPNEGLEIQVQAFRKGEFFL